MKYLRNPETSIFEIYVEDLIKGIQKYIKEDWAEELFDRYIKGL